MAFERQPHPVSFTVAEARLHATVRCDECGERVEIEDSALLDRTLEALENQLSDMGFWAAQIRYPAGGRCPGSRSG
jgi:hypothetical protein